MDGFLSGARQILKEGTLTCAYSPVKSFELRAEVRYDRSGANTATFFRRAPVSSGQLPDSDNLSEFALQAIYKFSAPQPPSAT